MSKKLDIWEVFQLSMANAQRNISQVHFAKGMPLNSFQPMVCNQTYQMSKKLDIWEVFKLSRANAQTNIFQVHWKATLPVSNLYAFGLDILISDHNLCLGKIQQHDRYSIYRPIHHSP